MLSEDLEIYLHAYGRLKQAANGRIKLSEMRAYCELFDIEDVEEFVDMTQLIERVLEEQSERRNADRQSQGSGRPDRGRARKSAGFASDPTDGEGGGQLHD